jgi:hypothetical protein
MAKMNWESLKKHGVAHDGPTVGSKRAWNMVRVTDLVTGEVRYEKPKPAKYKPKPKSNEVVINTTPEKRTPSKGEALKMVLLEQILDKQGWLNDKMQRELNRLHKLYKK